MSTGANSYLHHIPCKHQRIHILFSSKGELCWNGPHPGAQDKPYKFKKIKVTSYTLFEDNTIKLKTNSKQISNKYTNSWQLNNSLLDDECVMSKSRQKWEIPWNNVITTKSLQDSHVPHWLSSFCIFLSVYPSVSLLLVLIIGLKSTVTQSDFLLNKLALQKLYSQ